jgi:hypothetical protein
MMTRSEKRKTREARLAKTNRVKRLKSRLKGIHNRRARHQGNCHVTALMESYVLRRKAERMDQKRKSEPAEGSGTQDSVQATTPTAPEHAPSKTKSTKGTNAFKSRYYFNRKSFLLDASSL